MFKKSVYIIDALALAHRAYWTFKDLKTSEGRLTGVVYGASRFIEHIVDTYHPECLLVATDAPGDTFRHEIYMDYKANRKPKDESFIDQLPDFYTMFEKMGVPVMSMDGYEADDIIGSIVTQRDDVNFTIVSGDKDFMQLISPNVSLLRPLGHPDFELLTEESVIAKLGIRPDQVVDYLAICGDAADNIPGVKGIGPKGAEKLLKSYGDIEGIYFNLHQVVGKNYERLHKSVDNAKMSKKLAQIKLDLELEIDYESGFTFDCRSEEVEDFYYNELEFKGY